MTSDIIDHIYSSLLTKLLLVEMITNEASQISTKLALWGRAIEFMSAGPKCQKLISIMAVELYTKQYCGEIELMQFLRENNTEFTLINLKTSSPLHCNTVAKMDLLEMVKSEKHLNQVFGA